MRSRPLPQLVARAHEHRVHQAPEQARRDHDGLTLPDRTCGQLDQPADAGRPRPGHEVVGAGAVHRLAGQLEHRIRDVVHRHHVHGRRAARRHGRQRPAHERLQRRVEDVERRGPAGGALPDDDAGPEDLDREPPFGCTHEPLGLELRLLVGVAEPLPHVQLVLPEPALVGPGHVGGRDVGEVLEAAARSGTGRRARACGGCPRR